VPFFAGFQREFFRGSFSRALFIFRVNDAEELAFGPNANDFPPDGFLTQGYSPPTRLNLESGLHRRKDGTIPVLGWLEPIGHGVTTY
jgi:hypothetical protein